MTETKALSPLPASYKPLKDRGIMAETAKKYSVGVITGPDGSVLQHLYPYFNKDGEHVANKVRITSTKDFFAEGTPGAGCLFGQSAFPPGSAKAITVTEGEPDAMAAYEMQGSKYPVVSLKNGSSGAVKDFRQNWDYLDSFETIVLCFDSDEPGQKAAASVSGMFAPGKVKNMQMAFHKDANEYLKAGDVKAFIKEWWDAPTYMPEGLVLAKDLWEEIAAPRKYETVPYPYTKLQEMTYGMRLSELVVGTAETGVGKSTLMNELEYAVLMNPEVIKAGHGIGLLRLEETKVDACLGLMSVHANKPLHLPDVRERVTSDELRKYFDETINSDRIVIWDHFGSNSIGTVLDRIRHMAAMGCKYIILDHLSIIVSDQEGGDERKQLDEITTKLKTLCMELNIAVFAVIHQNRAGQIRGTAGVEQLANMVFKLHRDKTDGCAIRRNIIKIVVEKNRFCGRTGPSSYLWYNPETGRLNELDEEQAMVFEAGGSPDMKGERTDVWG